MSPLKKPDFTTEGTENIKKVTDFFIKTNQLVGFIQV